MAIDRRILIAAWPGLMGAAGVMLTAAAAHAAPGAGLDSAGQILLFHAAAVLGGPSRRCSRRASRARSASSAPARLRRSGALLFAGDLAAAGLLGPSPVSVRGADAAASS